MEQYGEMVLLICAAMFLSALIGGILHAVCKKTPRYLWIWGGVMGFCFFTVIRHAIVLISYDDLADPNYEIYKDWNLGRMIFSDILHLAFWTGVGVLSYLAFIRRKRILREGMLCAWIAFLAVILGPVLAIAALPLLSWINLHVFRILP